MNYLAHAFLSNGYRDILIGNMISDFVKGKKKYDYSSEIQSGIMLHRMIDQFTDEHPVTNHIKQLFRVPYRLYSGAFIDVVFDHFLANDTTQFFNEYALKDFTLKVYEDIEPAIEGLPKKFQDMFPHMKNNNWLYNYKFIWGIEKSFEGLKYRASYIEETDSANRIFTDHYTELKESYEQFFPELKQMVLSQF